MLDEEEGTAISHKVLASHCIVYCFFLSPPDNYNCILAGYKEKSVYR